MSAFYLELDGTRPAELEAPNIFCRKRQTFSVASLFSGHASFRDKVDRCISVEME